MILPLRFFDYYVYRKKQEEKRAMIASRVPNTSNITSTIGLKEKDLSISDYADNDKKDDSIRTPSKQENFKSFKFSPQVASGFDEDSNIQSNRWKKKKIVTNTIQSNNPIDKAFNSVYSNHKSSVFNNLTSHGKGNLNNSIPSQIDEGFKESEGSESISDYSNLPSFMGSSIPPPNNKKKFKLPQF
eukprot:CAMPEP_0205832150 /NCGR_PEP_ID=MMETSP0206-20130828/46193_1 /ASSEMBLY_ACC=CAM_ASM_000279 /TAXON_ID=36767 /ORGANISM="Euplotes focardii, Strain TN1" /LENGTH=185 /DNA_ID=CAMNT_0053137435 /DNA_START=493 /DNA_END=1050 /DNA_ORIENTATION=+